MLPEIIRLFREPMSEALATYLHDHLGGARAAIELLHAMRDLGDDQPLKDFAARLLVEVEADRDTLQGLAEKMDAGPSVLKEVAGWLGEKATRIKLGQGTRSEFSKFEALEFLALGVLGKMAMWQALDVASCGDERLRGYDFNHLAASAQAQYASVEHERLESAKRAFGALKISGKL